MSFEITARVQKGIDLEIDLYDQLTDAALAASAGRQTMATASDRLSDYQIEPQGREITGAINDCIGHAANCTHHCISAKNLSLQVEASFAVLQGTHNQNALDVLDISRQQPRIIDELTKQLVVFNAGIEDFRGYATRTRVFPDQLEAMAGGFSSIAEALYIQQRSSAFVMAQARVYLEQF